MSATRRTTDWVVLLGAPVVVGVLGVVHPLVVRDPVVELGGRVTFWLALHVILLAALALLAAAVWMLTSGLSGRAVAVSRVALPIFLVYYGAFDALLGLATGIYATEAAHIPGAAEAVRAFWTGRLTNPWVGAIYVPAALAWATAVIAAAMALSRHGVSRWTTAAFVAAAILFGVDHALPFGPLGMIALLAGNIMLLRRSLAPSPASYKR